MLGIPAKHAAYSIQDICFEDDPEEDYDGASYVVHLDLKYAMSANEIKELCGRMAYDTIELRGEKIVKPAMRPVKKDYHTEKEYSKRTKYLKSQWHDQYPASFKYSDP